MMTDASMETCANLWHMSLGFTPLFFFCSGVAFACPLMSAGLAFCLVCLQMLRQVLNAHVLQVNQMLQPVHFHL